MSGIPRIPLSIVTVVSGKDAGARYKRRSGLQRPMRDPATGLFEPDAFSELASDRLERGTINGGRASLAVFQLDLVEAGASDRSAATLARAIRDNIRPSDLATRTAPTTFIALLDRCDREEAKHVCSRIMRSAMRVDALGNLSCGIAVAPNDGSSLRELVASATRAPIRRTERVAAAAS